MAESRRQLRTAATNLRHRRRVLELLREKPAGETARCFRETLGLTTERTHVVLRTMVDDGLIEYADVFKRDRWEVGFKLSGGEKIPAGDKK
jgi:DNA-binding IclR family transcriptional regulator